MNSALLFTVTVILFALFFTIRAYGGIGKAIKFLSARPDVAKGIKLFAGAAIVVGLIFSFINPSEASADEKKGKFFAYGEIYVGLDMPFETSPQCDQGKNDRLTSHGGVRFNLYQSYDKRFEFNGKYTHHSCAFSGDQNLFDAPGLEISYKFFMR